MKICKALSMILTLVMCLSLAVPAFAAEVDPDAAMTVTDVQGNASVASPMAEVNIDGLTVSTNPIQANAAAYTHVMWKNTSTEYRVFINQGSLPSNIAIDVITRDKNYNIVYECQDFLAGFNGSRTLVLPTRVTDVYIRFRGTGLFGGLDHNSYYLNFGVEKI